MQELGMGVPAVAGRWMCLGMFSIAVLFTGMISSRSSAEQVQPQRSPIPALLRSALGCDVKLRGNGTGAAGGEGEMVNGYFSRLPRRGSAGSVFWYAQGRDTFLLAFARDGKLVHEQCSPLLVWHFVPKTPLSLSDKSEDLGKFTYVDGINRGFREIAITKNSDGDTPARTGPSDEKTTGMIIQDGDDSLMNQFYCYKGAWMVRVLH